MNGIRWLEVIIYCRMTAVKKRCFRDFRFEGGVMIDDAEFAKHVIKEIGM